MAATTTPRSGTPASTGLNDWMFGFVMGGVTLTLIAAIWGWSQLNYKPNPQRPRPVWMDIAKVISQLSDGRMLKLHVDLRLQNTEAVSALKPHQDIFKSMVEEVSAEMSHDELQGPEGMRKLSQHIRTTFNDYLADQEVPYRVKDVLFEEWTLMP